MFKVPNLYGLYNACNIENWVASAIRGRYVNEKRSANIIQKNPFTVNEVQFKFNPDQSPDPNQNQNDK